MPKKLVNMKLKKETLIKDHLNVFYNMVNWLVGMKVVIDNEMLTFLLLCSLLDSWETFLLTINNSIPNCVLSMELLKGNLYNEKTKRKTCANKMHKPLS